MDNISSHLPQVLAVIVFVIFTVQGRVIPLVPHSTTNVRNSDTSEVVAAGLSEVAESLHEKPEDSDADVLDGCIVLTTEQLAWLDKETEDEINLKNDEELMHLLGDNDEELVTPSRRRRKRKVTNFDRHPYMKWKRFPIIYKFDGKHSSFQQTIIRNAITHWSSHTCIRFQEVDFNEPITDNHVLFTKSSSGWQKCNSNVGRVYQRPQKIVLDSTCLWEFGTPVHEIGHALGLWHEHMRFDRDDYIRVNWEEVGDAHAWFRLVTDTVSLDVPYDYASVMHYSPKDASTTGGLVLEATDPLYQSSMGQRTGLSFADARIINHAYCSDVCQVPLTRQCANGGYQDPLHCDRCRCPDGLAGSFCDEVAPSVGASCGGSIQLNTTSAITISSPGYEQPGYYDNRVECNWFAQAPPGYQVRLSFIEDFSVYCHQQRECYHWVEVRYAGDIGRQGPRFCCNDRPEEPLISLGQDMLVVFRTNWTSGSYVARRGFKARLEAVPTGNPDPTVTATDGAPTTTTPTTTAAATTSTPATSTPHSSTTAPTPTTTPPSSSTTRTPGSFHWACHFEDPVTGEATLMGMEQSPEDQFDWTLWTGPTPSDETGPAGAHNGRYYVYIEASDPRTPGDQAILLLPDFRQQGSLCLRFHYHMSGHHINELRVQKVSGNGDTAILWTEQGQQGSLWLEGRVPLTLHTTDRVGFVGLRGSAFSGDIALDAIDVTQGSCGDNELFT